MPAVAPVSHSPLMDSDITRLPLGTENAQQFVHAQTSGNDTLEISGENKSHTLRSTIIGLIIAAAAVVALKHCSFMKVNDVHNMKWYEHPKQWINKLGEWVESPFVWVYNKFKGNKS